MIGGPRIKHIDEVEAHEVLRIEYDDGRTASVYERYMEWLPHFMSWHNVWEPGMIQRRHGHRGHHVVFVIKGEMWVGDRHCPTGTHIFLMDGDTFGPWVAGPDGCETIGIVAGEGASYATDEDEAAYQAMLSDHGARRGAVPPMTNVPPFVRTRKMIPGPTVDPATGVRDDEVRTTG